jgi:hypothetical protein
MTNYADITFYTGTYLAGKEAVIDTASFAFYARAASQIIKRFTFGNINETITIIDEVKMCCCELTERLYATEKQRKEANGKTSEIVGEYSVSYEKLIDIRANGDLESYQIIQNWLLMTGLMYRGCN